VGFCGILDWMIGKAARKDVKSTDLPVPEQNEFNLGIVYQAT